MAGVGESGLGRGRDRSSRRGVWGIDPGLRSALSRLRHSGCRCVGPLFICYSIARTVGSWNKRTQRPNAFFSHSEVIQRGRRSVPMPASFTGGCACREIRYECSAEPILSANCHCRLGSATFSFRGSGNAASANSSPWIQDLSNTKSGDPAAIFS